MESSVQARVGQEGSRWYNQRPSGDEVGSWFEANVQMPDGLEHEHYVSGVTLIQQKSKENEVVNWDGAKPIIDEIEHLVYVPYMKVETRVKFFWDFMAKHDDWVGFIDPVSPPAPPTGLPPGYFRYVVQANDGVVTYVCFAAQVTVYEKDSIEMKPITGNRGEGTRYERQGKIVMQGGVGSKAVPVLGRWGADDNALMKAETGAVGRALGLAGMLILPGSGVATAEDVQEALNSEGSGAVPAGEQVSLTSPAAAPAAAAPAPEETDEGKMREQVTALVAELEKLDEKRLADFREWCKERKFGTLAEANTQKLRGIIKRLEKDIAAAKEEQEEQEAPTTEQPTAEAPAEG